MKQEVRERREFQRLKLADPISGRFGTRSVRILELGVPGARIEHEGPIKSNSADVLVFPWDAESIEIEAEVVRSVISKSSPSLVGDAEHPAAGAHAIYQSGLQFLNAVGFSGQMLRRLLADAVRRLLETRRIQMAALQESKASVEDDETLRTRSFGFLSYTLEDGVWRKRRMFLPDQPEIGFTVSAGEDKEELQRICRAYEQADEEGRRLIRLFAELSVSEALNLPRTKPS